MIDPVAKRRHIAPDSNICCNRYVPISTGSRLYTAWTPSYSVIMFSKPSDRLEAYARPAIEHSVHPQTPNTQQTDHINTQIMTKSSHSRIHLPRNSTNRRRTSGAIVAGSISIFSRSSPERIGA